ncbi:MAG: oligoribonuclease [Pseudomonadales bacterium]|nr:oligoribonuclease [Pseudomonadales bacterium]
MDLEMSGLDPEVERILEMAVIITDSSLNIVAEGPVIYVRQEQALLDAMDEWNTQHHNDSGLVAKVLAEGISEADAEQQMLDFIRQYVGPREAPLCGNSIGQDRRFLVKYMPALEAYLHYRNIDVSSIKELATRWRPDIVESIVKQGSHRAIDDIRESVGELKAYRDTFFRLS